MATGAEVKINSTRPSSGEEEINAVLSVLESGWLIRRAQTGAFEAEFASSVGSQHAVATNGCTMDARETGVGGGPTRW